MGKRCQIRSGDQRCTLFEAGHKCGAAVRGSRRISASARPGQHSGGCSFQSSKTLGATPDRYQDGLKRKLLRMSAILLFVGSVGWCWPVFSELRSLISVSPAEASIHPHISYCQRFNRCRGKADSEIGKLDPFSSSTYAPSADPHVTRGRTQGSAARAAARIVARERSRLRTRVADARPSTRRNTRRKSRSRA